MKRTLLAWALVACSPLTGIRMVCVDVPPDAVAADGASAQCDRFCPRPGAATGEPAGRDATAQEPPPEVPEANGSHETGCVLFADGSLFLLVSGTAILPTAPPVDFSPTVVPFDLEDAYGYFAPPLAHHTPPPRA